MRLRGLGAGDDFAARHRDARRRHDCFGAVLVHGERRGEHAGMGVGNAQEFQHALDHAVLAARPVQGVEGDIRLHVIEVAGDIAGDIDGRDFEPLALERLGAGRARSQRHLALAGQAAHQYGDVFGHDDSLSGTKTGKRG